MLSPAPPRGQPPPGGSTGAGLGWGSQALPQGAIAPRGMAAPRSLFRAPCWGWGGSRGGGAAPDAAVGSLTGAWGRGGGSQLGGDLHSGPCSSTKVHEVIGDGGRLLPLPPAVFPLCTANSTWGWRGDSGSAPHPKKVLGGGVGGCQTALTSKAQGPQGSSVGLGGLPCGDKAER